MKTKAIHIVALLRIPVAIALLLVLAKQIVEAIAANKTTFSTPTPPLTQVQTDIDALDAAEVATKTKTVGTIQIRDEKRKALALDLHQLLAYVQQVANLSPEHAEAIIVSAGFRVRKSGTRPKSDLVVKPHVSGSVHLTAKAAKHTVLHEYQTSTDGKTWSAAIQTTKSSTIVSNLQSGVLTYFRHRSITRAGAGDWSAPVSIAVS
jgi:hypothetical protein